MWMKPPARTIEEVKFVLWPDANWLVTATAGKAGTRPELGGTVDRQPVSRQPFTDALTHQVVFYPTLRIDR